MLTVTDIAAVLRRQYKEVKKRMKGIEESETAFMAGYYLGLQRSVANINEILSMVEIEDRKNRELLRFIFREDEGWEGK